MPVNRRCAAGALCELVLACFVRGGLSGSPAQGKRVSKTVSDRSSGKNLEELNTIMRREGIYLRRTKDQVLKELPGKRRVYVPVEIPARAYQTEIKRIKTDLRATAPASGLS